MLKKYVEFIVANGGSDYYIWLLDNIDKANISEEIEEIKSLFKIWMEEFTWKEEDIKFMKKIF